MKTRLRADATLALLCSALFACGDGPFGPGDTYPLQIEAFFTSDAIVVSGDGFATVECRLALEASTTASVRATWTSFIISRFGGPGFATLEFRDTMLVAERGLVAGSRGWVRAGRPDTLFFGQFRSLPSALEVQLGYRAGGDPTERFTPPHRVTCGPGVPAGTPEPTITYLGWVGEDSLFTVGDSVGLRYRVSDGAAIWQTRAQVSGPFSVSSRRAEVGAAAVERTQWFRVERGFVSGAPLALRIEATDVLGRIVTLDTVTAAAVLDTVAPVIVSSSVDAARWATGVPQEFSVLVRENNAPAWLIWEFDGEFSVRDSLPVGNPNGEFPEPFQITAPAEWGGKAARLRVWIRDRAGLLSAPASSAPLAYNFYESTPASTLAFAVLPLQNGGSDVADVIYDRTRDRLYSANPVLGRLTVADAATGAIVSQLELPPIPGSLDLSRSGDSLFVTQSTEWKVAVVDLNSLTHIGDIEIDLADSIRAEEPGNPPLPNGLRVAANGKLFVMLHRTTLGGHRILDVDAATGASVVRTDAGGFSGGIGQWWRRTASGQGAELLYFGDVGCPRFYASSLDAFGACGPAALGELEASQLSVDSASGRLLIAGRLYDAQLAALGQLPETTVGALLPGGEFAVVAWGNGIAKMRLSDGRVLRHLSLSFGTTPGRILFTADGDALVESGGGGVRRIDLTAFGEPPN